MANHGHQVATLFGKVHNLEQEWQKIAASLEAFQEDGNRYLEYEKEITRLKARVIHLQGELEKYRTRNQNLSSINDDLLIRVKDLISDQDSQLEQYSSAIILLTEERKELWSSLSESQKKINHLENRLKQSDGKSAVIGRDSNGNNSPALSDEISSEDTSDMLKRLQLLRDEDVSPTNNSVISELLHVPSPSTYMPVVRHLDSIESSMGSPLTVASSNSTPSKVKTKNFVNSMVEKLEKQHRTKTTGIRRAPRSNTDAESTASTDSSESENMMKLRILELEQEVGDLRQTCQSLTDMLDRTYEEMTPPPEESHDDTKDQLIACLRSRLFEAIRDLMKTEKDNPPIHVKSVGCGPSLPALVKTSTAEFKNDIGLQSKSEPVLSPSKSKGKMFLSPSKLKEFSGENYGKLKKFSCWKPKST